MGEIENVRVYRGSEVFSEEGLWVYIGRDSKEIVGECEGKRK